MDIEKKFIRNYLSKTKYSYAHLWSLFVLTICVVISLFYWDKSFEFTQYLAANKQLVFEKQQFWRLISSTFIHGDLDHLLSNTMMLLFLSYFVYSFYGPFISFFLIFILSVFLNAWVLSYYPSQTYLVGASGVVYILWGFWLTLFIGISKHLSVIKRLIRVAGLFFILLVPTTYSPTTSYLAHYLGFILGVLVGSLYYLKTRKIYPQYELWEYRVVEDDELDEALL